MVFAKRMSHGFQATVNYTLSRLTEATGYQNAPYDANGNPAVVERLIKSGANPNTTVDGYPAFRSTAGAGQPMLAAKSAQGRIGFETLCVFGVKGLNVCFMSEPRATQALKATGGLTGLFQRTKSLGPDPSAWTTDPLG